MIPIRNFMRQQYSPGVHLRRRRWPIQHYRIHGFSKWPALPTKSLCKNNHHAKKSVSFVRYVNNPSSLVLRSDILYKRTPESCDCNYAPSIMFLGSYHTSNTTAFSCIILLTEQDRPSGNSSDGPKWKCFWTMLVMLLIGTDSVCRIECRQRRW